MNGWRASFMKIWGQYSGLGLGVALATVLADQFHKMWMVNLFSGMQTWKIAITPFFDLVLIWNHGISYGLFKQDSDFGRWALVAISFAAVLALIFWLAHLQTRLSAASVGLIAGGALGNAIDRIHYGAVADFFSFHVAGLNWYVFNLADVAIVAGVAGLLYDSFKSSHKSAGNEI
jgi:signal peptidase II